MQIEIDKINIDSDFQTLQFAVYFSEDIVQLHCISRGEEESSQTYIRVTGLEGFCCLRPSLNRRVIKPIFFSLILPFLLCQTKIKRQPPNPRMKSHSVSSKTAKRSTNSQATLLHASVPMNLVLCSFHQKREVRYSQNLRVWNDTLPPHASPHQNLVTSASICEFQYLYQ